MIALIDSLAKLFARLWDVLRALGSWLLEGFSKLFEAFFKFPAWFWQLWLYVSASLIVVVTATVDAAEFAVGLFDMMLTKAGGISVSNLNPQAGAAASIFAAMNTFFPLDELFAMLVAYSFIYLTSAVIRFLKGWVPTWN